MIISLWGKERRMKELRALLCKKHTCVAMDALFDFDLSKLDALVLPMQGVQGEKGDYMDRAHIELPTAFWECLREDCQIISGRPTRFLSSLIQPKYYFLNDETFVTQNAQLTAQGALFYVLDHADCALTSCSVDILGKGHCGTAIGELLEKLGVSVRYVRHNEAKGLHECTLEEWKRSTCAPILLHCAPYRLIDEDVLSHWKQPVCLIDISGGAGQDEKLLRQKGCVYVRAASLPEQFAYKSSAAAMAQFVERVLHE